jgi:hypothetical protein
MDPNEHSPIARCIEKMQQKWIAAVEQNPDYKLVCWQIAPEEADLLNGLCKLESSLHGSLSELFVVMLTPFESEETFSREIIRHWLQLWEADPILSKNEHLPLFQDQALHTQHPEGMLPEVLHYFYRAYGNTHSPVVLGLIPHLTSNLDAYNQWVERTAKALPEGVKLMVVDHLDKHYLKPACKGLKDKTILIPCGDLGLHEAMQELATSGDPNVPEVQFRQCLFHMGAGASAKNRSQVEEWGEKALLTTQRSGKHSFMATAHLVYAGFLMHFRAGDKIHGLLNEGIRLAKTALQAGDQSCTPILLQLYGYKSAWHSMCAEGGVAAEWMGKQAHLAIEQGLLLQAVTACRMTAHLYKQNGNTEPFTQYTILGYQTGLALDDETLKSSDYVLLASDYFQWCQKANNYTEAQAVDKRMSQLYGEDWQAQLTQQQASGKFLALSPVL